MLQDCLVCGVEKNNSYRNKIPVGQTIARHFAYECQFLGLFCEHSPYRLILIKRNGRAAESPRFSKACPAAEIFLITFRDDHCFQTLSRRILERASVRMASLKFPYTIVFQLAGEVTSIILKPATNCV